MIKGAAENVNFMPIEFLIWLLEQFGFLLGFVEMIDKYVDKKS